MKVARLVFGFLLLLVFPVFFPADRDGAAAMDWPDEEPELVHNFGWNREGEPLLGAVFKGKGFIQAADDAELLFISGRNEAASRFPSPMGVWTALDHGDGIVSIYSHYDDGRDYKIPFKVSRGSAIAMSGKSGWTDTEGFHFSLFDRRERRWVNPSMVIAPLEDKQPPVIQSVALIPVEQGKGRGIVDLSHVRSASQGRYAIAVAAADSFSASAGNYSLAPHRIVCSLNGAEVGSLIFETISARDGIQLMNRNGLTPVSKIYGAFPRYEIGEVWLTRGIANLEVITGDFSGNSRGAVYRLQIE